MGAGDGTGDLGKAAIDASAMGEAFVQDLNLVQGATPLPGKDGSGLEHDNPPGRVHLITTGVLDALGQSAQSAGGIW
jgi:hypothetical protein